MHCEVVVKNSDRETSLNTLKGLKNNHLGLGRPL